MKIDRARVLKAFDEYVRNYDNRDQKVHLKIEHTHRVSGLCERIAASLNLSQEDVELSWLLGMLHDIGRFEQLKNYGTFIDSQSIDHAIYGAQILFGQGKIRDFVKEEEEDGLLQTAVTFHSAYRLPESLDHRTRMFCNILRDADKIDILKANVDCPLEEIYNVTTEELRNSVISKEVMKAFREKHAVLKSLKKTPADCVVSLISLVYELVYPLSLEIIKEQGYLNQVMDFKWDNPETVKQFQEIRRIMTGYLDRS